MPKASIVRHSCWHVSLRVSDPTSTLKAQVKHDSSSTVLPFLRHVRDVQECCIVRDGTPLPAGKVVMHRSPRMQPTDVQIRACVDEVYMAVQPTPEMTSLPNNCIVFSRDIQLSLIHISEPTRPRLI
eukprot:39992-Amphidinium_carterae.1